jgi:tripartite-type tricarboxylate transporter receptor subunit TctC
MQRRHALTLGAAGLLISWPGRAQPAWPDRPVTVISPYPPGGGSDIIGRAVATALGDATG